MQQLFKCEAIEIEVGAVTGTNVPIPDQSNLRNVPIQKIQVLTTDLIIATPISGSTPMSIADLKKCFLVMQFKSNQAIQNIPLMALNETANPANAYTNNPVYMNRVFSWDKCFINIKGTVSASVVTLLVWYDDRGVDTNV